MKSPPLRFLSHTFKPAMAAAAICAGMIGFTVPSARALTLFGVPFGHDVDPANGLGWDNVGSVGGASGVYLGSFATGYWVITANHVPTGTFGLGGNNYAMVADSARRIGSTDLSIFRIASDPLLPNLNLAATTPAFGASVWMVGFGGGVKNWGTNTREGQGYSVLGSSLTYSISTDFDPVAGEAQGIGGDSGGALFFQNGGEWVLGGILSSVMSANGKDYTIASNIASYRTQILALTGSPSGNLPATTTGSEGTTPIPEPSAYAAILGALVFGALVCSRRGGRARDVDSPETHAVG